MVESLEKIAVPPENYKPQENEPYMNPVMLAYFEKLLLDWRQKLLTQSDSIKNNIQEHTAREADFVDAGVTEEMREVDYSLAARDIKLLGEIDQAINRINEGSYGFCTETGEEIGIKRLESWPIAKFTVEAQEKN
jgi:DnaK suppressor protein